MARIITNNNNPLYTDTQPFLTEERKTNRITPDQGSKLDRFARYLKTADSIIESPAIGAAAGLIAKGVKKLGEYNDEYDAQFKQETKAKELESQATEKEKAAQALFNSKQESVKPIETPDLNQEVDQAKGERQYRTVLQGLYDEMKSGKMDEEQVANFRETLKEGVDKRFISKEQAGKVAERVKSMMEPKLQAGEKEAQGLKDQEDILLKRNQSLRDQSEAIAKNLDQLAKDDLDNAKISSPEQAKVLIERANEQQLKARQIRKDAVVGKYDASLMQKEQQDFYGKQSPDKLTAEQVIKSVDEKPEQSLFEMETDPVKSAAFRVVEAGKSVEVLKQLKQKKNLSQQEQQLAKEIISMESEKRQQDLESKLPTGEMTPEQKALFEGLDSKGVARIKSSKKDKNIRISKDIPGTPLYQEYTGGIPQEQPSQLEKEAEAKYQEAEQQRLQEEKDRKDEATKIGRDSQRLYDEAQSLKEQAKAEREKKLDEKKSYSTVELEAMAAKANTPELREQVLKLIDQSDVAPATLGDLISGNHKRRFAKELVSVMPKLSVQKPVNELDQQMKLLRLKALSDKMKNAPTESARKAAKAELEDELKLYQIEKAKQEAGLETPEDKVKRMKTSGNAESLVDTQKYRNKNNLGWANLGLRQDQVASSPVLRNAEDAKKASDKAGNDAQVAHQKGEALQSEIEDGKQAEREQPKPPVKDVYDGVEYDSESDAKKAFNADKKANDKRIRDGKIAEGKQKSYFADRDKQIKESEDKAKESSDNLEAYQKGTTNPKAKNFTPIQKVAKDRKENNTGEKSAPKELPKFGTKNKKVKITNG